MEQRDSSDSIYRTPTSDTTVTPDGDEMAVFVGPRFDEYYASRFAGIQQGAGVSWHWPAFFIASFWLLYRKMWAYAASYWLLLPLVIAIIAGFVSAAGGTAADQVLYFNVVYYGAYAVVGFILMPLYANRLYYRFANKKLEKIAQKFPDSDQQRLELARKGGTSSIIVVVLPFILIVVIGILAAISIPAYQDYTIRAQVSEGLSLSGGAKAAVADYYRNQGELPADNETIGLAPASEISGNYVDSVSVEQGNIVIGYGGQSHSLLDGKTLVLQPMVEDGLLEWGCYSDSIDNRHLPARCR